MKIKKIAALVSACSMMLLSALPVSAADTKAFISGSIGTAEVWSVDKITAGSVAPEIDGDAQYEAVFKVDPVSSSTDVKFLALSISNITSDSYPDLNVKIDAVYIDGVLQTDYKMSAAALDMAYYEPHKDPETRVYILDTMKNSNVTDLPLNVIIRDNIKVIFTVSGMGVNGTSNVTEVPTEATTEATTEAPYNPDDVFGTTTTEYQYGYVDQDDNTIVYGDSTPVDASTTGDAGVAALAVGGLILTAGAAIISKVKFRKK